MTDKPGFHVLTHWHRGGDVSNVVCNVSPSRFGYSLDCSSTDTTKVNCYDCLKRPEREDEVVQDFLDRHGY